VEVRGAAPTAAGCESLGGRRWALGGAIGGLAAALAGRPRRAEAAITGGAREAIADLASGIPGYGPSDVFYPEWFLGDWEATSELSEVETPQGDELAGDAVLRARKTVGMVERYNQRYIEYRGRIIADRGYNVRALVRGSGPRLVESVEWDPTNPNVLSMVLKRDGASVRTDLRVTRRTVAAPEGRDDLFNVSEFYQEVVGGGDLSALALGAGVGSQAAAPKVTPVRCITKYRRVAGPQIQALQRLEVFPALLGPDARDFGDVLRGSGADRDKPVAVYRYRGILVPASTDRPLSQQQQQQPAEQQQPREPAVEPRAPGAL